MKQGKKICLGEGECELTFTLMKYNFQTISCIYYTLFIICRPGVFQKKMIQPSTTVNVN